MKKIFLLLALACTACTEISYKEPQPKGITALSEVPSALHGKYLMGKDTVIFFQKGLRGMDKGKEEFLLLSDSLVLKEYKKTFFANYQDGNLWLLRVFQQEKNGDIYRLEMRDVPSEEPARIKFIEKLSKETPVLMIDSTYVIDPSPKKLYSLIQKGYFKKQEEPWMKKIN